jgi:arylsulfatase A-like enzyme
VLAGICVLPACTHRSPPPNILFIVIDTLRADRVGWYLGDRRLTEFLDSVGAWSTVFWNAYAQGSFTPPSMASLFTSRYPSQHGVRTGRSVLSSAERTLAEELKQGGYVTGGFVANPLLTATLGYRQGLDTYEVLEGPDTGAPPGGSFARKARADDVNRAGLKWLDTLTGNAPVFLYLHYMEPHLPYTPPDNIRDQIMSRRGKLQEEQQTLGRMLFFEHKLWTHPDQDALYVIQDLYDAEVVSVDAALKDLFAELERRGFLRNAIVVITADHGDEHMDHGRIGHGTTLYNEVTHVPLLLHAPGQRNRVDVRDIVSLIDVAPTVLQLAGLRAPDSFEGHCLATPTSSLHLLRSMASYLSRLLGTRSQPRAYSQLLEPPLGVPSSQRLHSAAVVVGSRKLVVGVAGSESYDLETDPAEQHPNTMPAPEQQVLAQALKELSVSAQRAARREQVQALDERTKERMRALGYGD